MNMQPVIAFDLIDTLLMRNAHRHGQKPIHPQTLEFLNILRNAGFRVVIITSMSNSSICSDIDMLNEDFIVADFKDRAISNLRDEGHPHVFYVSDASVDAAEALNGDLDGVIIFENLHCSTKTHSDIEGQREINAELLASDLRQFGYADIFDEVKHVVGFDELYKQLKAIVTEFGYALPDINFIDYSRPRVTPFVPFDL